MRYKQVGQCKDCTTIQEKELVAGLCSFHYRVRKSKIMRDKYFSKKQTEKRAANKKTIFQRYYQSHKLKEPTTRKKPGKKVKQDDADWYRRCWDKSIHNCQECGIYLGERLRRIFVSHILTKGAHNELRNHEENFNILCPKHHDQWEFGNRKEMKIWNKNKAFINRFSLIDTE